ncbi:MAG: double zinc ribbon domain-containing protein [Spirochaetaceae bacterium]|jgi:ComF family protein|nr:double zinc ribbon domain-containing protein [Spirochaetaceae bacterium]
MMNLRQFAGAVEEYLFPRGCAVCGAMLMDPEEAQYGLCAECRAGLTIAQETRCSQCGRPLISEIGVCLACRNGEPWHADQSTALFPYTGIYRDLLSAYKFGRYRRTGVFLAEKILEGLALLPLSPSAELVPVPPRPGKLKKTGWDQISVLAAILSRTKSCPRICRCLKRLPSQSQKELDKENRKINLTRRIRHTRKVPKEAVVFDDVITTGSTLNACAAALKEAGAEKVYGICLFYA